MTGMATKPQKTNKISLDELSTVIAESRDMAGLEVIQVGRLGTAALKQLANLSIASEDGGKEARALMNVIRGVKKVAIVDYDDCSDVDKARFTRRVENILTPDCLLMEAKDGGQQMKIYAVYDEKSDKFDNFVMYAPADCALICLFGSIPLSAVTTIASL